MWGGEGKGKNLVWSLTYSHVQKWYKKKSELSHSRLLHKYNILGENLQFKSLLPKHLNVFSTTGKAMKIETDESQT